MIRSDTLAGNLQAFLIDARVRELADDTIADYRRFLTEFIRFLAGIGITKPDAITRQHVQLFLLKKRETCNKESVLHYYRDIRRLLNWLVSEQVLKYSVLAGWKPPKADDVLIKPFEGDQLRGLLALCDDSFLGLRNRAMILLFLDTGLRKKELAGLQLDDVDFDHELVTTKGKGNKERYVRMGKRTQRALLRYLMQRRDREPGLWVSEERGPLQPGAIYQMLHKLGQRAGISGVRCSPHTLRHTAGTMALENGAQERQVQELLGHATAAMTRRYTKTLQSKWAAEAHKKFGPVDNLKL